MATSKITALSSSFQWTLIALMIGVFPAIAHPAISLSLSQPESLALGLKQRYSVTPPEVLANAYRNRTSNLQVLVQGRVVSVLSDDTQGDRHQRFILELANGQTLLIAHNIDLAPRVSGLRVGDTLYVYGEYEWNERGGVIHWTHHDPNGRHVDGWIDRNGTVFR